MRDLQIELIFKLLLCVEGRFSVGFDEVQVFEELEEATKTHSVLIVHRVLPEYLLDLL